MRDLNMVALNGRLVRDAELKYTQGGTAILSFTVASSADYKDTKHTNFVDCTLFGKLGEAISQYMTKGKQVSVGGELRQDKWQDRETGQNRSKLGVIVKDLQLLGAGKKEDEDEVPF